MSAPKVVAINKQVEGYPVTVARLREVADQMERGEVKSALLTIEYVDPEDDKAYRFIRAGSDSELMVLAAVQYDQCLRAITPI